MLSARDIRELRTFVQQQRSALCARKVEARAEAIEAACALLCDDGSEPGRELRFALGESSGLSAAGIEHGLQTTLARFTRAELLALHAKGGGADRAAGNQAHFFTPSSSAQPSCCKGTVIANHGA